MIIEKIQKNKLYLSNQEIIDISSLIRQKYNLKTNDNIESLYDDISYEASLEKGIFLISLKDRTRKELKMKLNEKYKNTQMVEKAVDKLVELGYVNDLDYSVSYITRKKYGRERITYNLIQKGISKDIVNEAYLVVEEERRDMEGEKIYKAIMKNMKKDEWKLIQYLVRQGFSLDNIFKKLKEIKEKGE